LVYPARPDDYVTPVRGESPGGRTAAFDAGLGWDRRCDGGRRFLFDLRLARPGARRAGGLNGGFVVFWTSTMPNALSPRQRVEASSHGGTAQALLRTRMPAGPAHEPSRRSGSVDRHHAAGVSTCRRSRSITRTVAEGRRNSYLAVVPWTVPRRSRGLKRKPTNSGMRFYGCLRTLLRDLTHPPVAQIVVAIPVLL